MRRRAGARRFPIHHSAVCNRLIRASCVLGAALSVSPVLSAQVSIAPGLRTSAPARSMKDLRDQNLIKQRFDFSCGAAALATLIRYGFGQHVTEDQILVDLFDLPSEAEKADRERTGFSLL